LTRMRNVFMECFHTGTQDSATESCAQAAWLALTQVISLPRKSPVKQKSRQLRRFFSCLTFGRNEGNMLEMTTGLRPSRLSSSMRLLLLPLPEGYNVVVVCREFGRAAAVLDMEAHGQAVAFHMIDAPVSAHFIFSSIFLPPYLD